MLKEKNLVNFGQIPRKKNTMSFLQKLKNKIEERGAENIVQAMEREDNNPLTKWGRLGNALFFIVFALSGLPVMYFTYPWLVNGVESENWPTTDGVVTLSEIYDVRGNKGGVTYGAEILYEYYVSDKRYLGNHVTSAGQSSSSDLDYAQYLINKYPNGTKVTIYYNPNKAEEAVLEPGFHWFDLFPFGMGLIFSLIGLIGFIWSLKNFNEPPKKRTYNEEPNDKKW